MKLYQLINEVVGSTQQSIQLKDLSQDEIYYFIPEKNQISFSTKKGQNQLIGPVSQIVQSRKNPKIINAVIDYHYRHVNLRLDLSKSPYFFSKLPTAALPIKIAAFDTKQNKYIVKSNEKRLKQQAPGDVTDPVVLEKYLIKKVIPALKYNIRDLIIKVEPYVKTLIKDLSRFLMLESKKKKPPINEEIEIYEYTATDPNTGERRHGTIQGSSEEAVINHLKKNYNLKDIKINWIRDLGYSEKPSLIRRITDKFRPKEAKEEKKRNLELGQLQARIIVTAKNILMIVKSKLDLKSLNQLYQKYKKAGINNSTIVSLYDFIRNLSNFEEILQEAAFLGHTEDKLKDTLSQAGNTNTDKASFKNAKDHSKFLAELYDKLLDYAEY